jgi:hypothetical protein
MLNQKPLETEISSPDEPKYALPNEACSYDTDNTDLLAYSAYYQVNEVDQPTYGCEYCQDTFFSKYLMDKHRATHTKRTEIYCSQCVETFYTKYQFDVHMQEMHCAD